MEINLNLELENNIQNIMKLNQHSITSIVCDINSNEEYITAYDKVWTSCYKLITKVYDNFNNYFSIFTESDLVIKSGYDVGENNLNGILTMSKSINKDNILEVVCSGEFNSSDKYALYNDSCGLITTNDIGDYIDYEGLVQLMNDDEYSELNKYYQEAIDEISNLIFLSNHYQK